MIESERALFERTLEQFYGIQRALDELQPRLAAEATDENVEEFFTAHHAATRDQLGRVEDCFNPINAEPHGRDVAALDGMIEDHDARRADVDRPDFDDLSAIEVGKSIERLEITKLETLLVLAERLTLDGDVIDSFERSKTEAENGLERLRGLAVEY